jgi:Phosphotransferase enzyme family
VRGHRTIPSRWTQAPDDVPGRTAYGRTVRSTWTDPSWLATVQEWAETRLAEVRRPVTGRWEQPHAQPWSTALRAPTKAGTVWLKANGPGTSFEPRLVHELARLSRLVPAPLALDTERAWALLPDGGDRLRDRLGAEPRYGEWEQVLSAYAELQRAATQEVDRLVFLGVPEVRPEALPELLDGLLADRKVTDGLDQGDLDRLRALQEPYAQWCRELAAGGVPATIQHDDLHDGNVLCSADGFRVIDWGDTAIAHPFSTLLVTLRSIAHRWELVPDDPGLLRLRDAYLEPWTADHSSEDLRRLAALAVAVAPVGRALAWRRALIGVDGDARAEWWPSVPGWLGELGGPPAT